MTATTSSPQLVDWLAWLPQPVRPENTAQTVVLLIAVCFALGVGLYTWFQWQIDLRRLLWAGRLTRTMLRQGWAIHRQARREAGANGISDQDRIKAVADAAWEDRPLLDAEVEARLALWLLSQTWHDGPDHEHRLDEGWVFVTRREALRLVRKRRRLRELFEQMRHRAGNLPRNRETLLQLVPEVGGGIQGSLPL